MTTIVEQFTECLNIISHTRAGWDYDLPRDQREKEKREEREAMARVREIWAGNPSMHDELRAAFSAANPLATLAEIEAATSPTA